MSKGSNLMLGRRAVLLGAGGSLATMLDGAPAAFAARPYPSRPIAVIVGSAAGTGNDVATRLVTDYINRKTGARFIVENKPGASGARACEYFAAKPADGYTLLLGNPATHGYNEFLIKNTTFNAKRDTTPIAPFALSANMMVVSNKLGVKSVADFVAYAKARPGQLNFGSAGYGGSIHLATAYFNELYGIDAVHVPYLSSSEMILDIMSGKTHYAFDNLPNSIQNVHAGTLTALAVTSEHRWPDAPGLPTMVELGHPEFVLATWYGLFARTGTDPQIVNLLTTQVNGFLDDPAEAPAKLPRIGAIPFKMSPAEFTAFLEKQQEFWGIVIKKTGVHPIG